jgi:V/A-type H+-transporting ATPase subunit D
VTRIPIPATRSQLLLLRSELDFLAAGRDLLDQKRDFLTGALVDFAAEAERLRKQAEVALAQAYAQLAESEALLGAQGLERLALAAEPAPAPVVRERSLMGVAIPVTDRTAVTAAAPALVAAPAEGGAAAEAAARRLRDLVPLLAQLAEVETSCRRLARDLQRTRRKLNALEIVHIPAHRETIRFIADQLEEREREELFQLKRVRSRRGDAR